MAPRDWEPRDGRVTHTAWVGARMPEALAARLDEISKAEDRPVSSIVRLALRDYADRFDSQHNDPEAAA